MFTFGTNTTVEDNSEYAQSSQIPAWSVPTSSQLGQRAYKNVTYFASNYALFAAALTVYEVLSDWSIIFWLGLVAVGWYLFRQATHQRRLNFPVQVGSVLVTERTAQLSMTALTAVILTWALGSVFLWVIGATLVFAGIHAMARNPASYKDKHSLPGAGMTGTGTGAAI